MSKLSNIKFSVISAIFYSLSFSLMSGYRDEQLFWNATDSIFLFTVLGTIFLLSTLISILFLGTAIRLKDKIYYSTVALVILIVLLVFILYFANLRISRLSVIYMFGLAATFIYISIFLNKTTLNLLLSIIVAISSIYIASKWIPLQSNSDKSISTDYIYSNYHDLKITNYNLPINHSQDGGAIAFANSEKIIIVAADGSIYTLTLGLDNIEILRHNIVVPLNLDIYQKNSINPNKWYRVVDALLVNTGDDIDTLFATYTYWDQGRDCYSLRLSKIPFSKNIQMNQDWETLFESKPCINLKQMTNETAGRMALTKDRSLLFTVGNFEFDKQFPNKYADSNYGKVYKINLETLELLEYSSGHRDGQGLLIAENRIWETEHGPHGGDELNLLIQGNDYGWPYQSYGTDYDKKYLSSSNTTGDHSDSTRPIYAWLPSIGISNLIQVEGKGFYHWKNDLLVGSLYGGGNGFSLYRTRIREGRVVSIERIKTKYKVRDLVEMNNGRVAIWSGLYTLQILEPATSIFSQCSGCHTIRKNTQGIGPSLWGVVNSPVARHEQYKYSQSIINFGGKWTPNRLDRFLENPKEVIPGTAMDFPGIKDEKSRKELIEYLLKVSDSLP